MNKQLLVVCALLAAQVKAGIEDEVHVQLEELRSIVEGGIFVAHDELDNSQVDFLSYSDGKEQYSLLSIEEQEQVVHGELTVIKDMSWAGGKDPASCIIVREEVLGWLAGEYLNDTRTCIQRENNEARRIVRDARYIVDVSINKVHNIDFQIGRCGGEILCLSPLMTEISLDMVRLPQNIRTEVQAATTFLSALKLSVQTCGESRVAQYATESLSIIRDITACINRLLESGNRF